MFDVNSPTGAGQPSAQPPAARQPQAQDSKGSPGQPGGATPPPAAQQQTADGKRSSGQPGGATPPPGQRSPLPNADQINIDAATKRVADAHTELKAAQNQLNLANQVAKDSAQVGKDIQQPYPVKNAAAMARADTKFQADIGKLQASRAQLDAAMRTTPAAGQPQPQSNSPAEQPVPQPAPSQPQPQPNSAAEQPIPQPTPTQPQPPTSSASAANTAKQSPEATPLVQVMGVGQLQYQGLPGSATLQGHGSTGAVVGGVNVTIASYLTFGAAAVLQGGFSPASPLILGGQFTIQVASPPFLKSKK
jgi:hypothetical protein